MNDYSQDRFFEVDGGAIVRGPFSLPKSTKHTSGIWNLSLAELADRGFYRQVRLGDDLVPSASQVKEGPVNAVNGTEVTSTWTLRAKTQAELDDDAAAAAAEKKAQIVSSADLVLGKALFILLNQFRESQGQNALTKAQFLSWLRGL